MRFTCHLCTLLLIALGIFGAVYAFTGFDFLLFLCFGAETVRKSFLAVCGVAALFNIYSLIIFKPYRGLK